MENDPILEVVALALCRPDGRFMLARRGPGESGAGEWEFPGGKVEPGESHEQALRREIREELQFDLGPESLIRVAENLHCYPQRRIRIHLWLAHLAEEEPVFILSDHDRTAWFTCDDMPALAMSAGDRPFIELLRGYSRK